MSRRDARSNGPSKRGRADVRATLAAFERIETAAESYQTFDEAVAAGIEAFTNRAIREGLASEISPSEQEQLAYEVADQAFKDGGGTDIDTDPRWMFRDIDSVVARALSLTVKSREIDCYDELTQYVDRFVGAAAQRQQVAQAVGHAAVDEMTPHQTPAPRRSPAPLPTQLAQLRMYVDQTAETTEQAPVAPSKTKVLAELRTLRRRLGEAINYANLYAAGYDIERVYEAGFERLGDATDQVNASAR